MKNSLWIVIVIVLLCLGATSNTDQEVAKALREQNQQLARIATSLEKISGQQPGWKLPH
jgi:hypothetical protein